MLPCVCAYRTFGNTLTFKETVVHGKITTEHFVQLFDTTESLAATVSEFLRTGFLQGQTLLVVSTESTWDAISCRLNDDEMRSSEARESGQLTWLDAAEALKGLMKYGQPDGGLFDASIGMLVRQLASRSTGLRIYGEMVDLLAVQGDYRSAQALEELWNDLGERESFTLFCGYSSANFGNPRTADALRSICGAHSHVRFHPRDLLGSFLSHQHGPSTPSDDGPAAGL